MRNTLTKGQIRSIVFKDADGWHAVALEFNIVESGDDPREVMLLLDEAIRGYLKSARKAKLHDNILNQKTDAEYETLWNQIENKKPTKSSIEVYSSSSFMIPSFA